MINGNTPGIATFLQDVYDAVDKTPGGWEWFKSYDPPEGESFLWCKHPKLKEVTGNMKFLDNHSGSSLAFVLRTIEFIAKHGWDAYAKNE